MNPILWAKIVLVGVFLVGVFISGHRIGANAVQADWDRDKAQRIEAQDKLIADHDKDIAALQAKHDAITVKVGTEHDQALQAIQTKYNADLAAVRAAGGLRIPRSACDGPVVARTETAGTVSRDDNASDSIALSDRTSSDLLSLAAEADRTTEVARACQTWIRANGFYGALPAQ